MESPLHVGSSLVFITNGSPLPLVVGRMKSHQGSASFRACLGVRIATPSFLFPLEVVGREFLRSAR